MRPRPSGVAVQLETERFLLKPLNSWDTFRISYRWTKDAELMRTFTQSTVQRSLRKWRREVTLPNNRNRFSYAIVPKGERQCIGIHSLRTGGHRSAQLSVMIHDRAWWGKGVVPEVRTCLIDHFIAKAAVERFWSSVESRNFASVFNYRKLGFEHVGTLHRARSNPVGGEVFDMLVFELMASDWIRRKEASAGE
jgi:RimJ/RimL family protein N-acetyltransferase